VGHEIGYASARLIIGKSLAGDEGQDVGSDGVGRRACRLLPESFATAGRPYRLREHRFDDEMQSRKLG